MTVFKFPDTGQMRCYDRDGHEIHPLPGDEFYGQNGCFAVHPMSFTKLDRQGSPLPSHALWEDGLRMVLDNNTRLIWEIKSPDAGDVNHERDSYSWHDAQEIYPKKLNKARYGGFDDWRIPNKDELRSIVDYSRSTPAIDPWYFPDNPIRLYWCSPTYQMQPCFGWVIFFGLGSATAASKESLQYVRAVRGGSNPLFGLPDKSRFTNNGDGTVTDRASGLMWQQAENSRADWYEALTACQNMRLAGYDDWRLPNIKELDTLLNLNYDDGWWYFRDFFPGEGLVPPLLHYFSSTVYEKTYAWVTNFNYGYNGYYANKNAKLLFRAVRNIEPPTLIIPQFRFPDTGQVDLYDDEGHRIETPHKGEPFYGQDAMFTSCPMSFTRLRDGGLPADEATWDQGWRMVLDNNTGLEWETKSPQRGDLNYRGNRFNWHDAKLHIDALNKTNYGGFDNWRLPNREELRTIVVYDGTIPSVNHSFFPDMQPDFYWSNDPYAADPKLIWGMYYAYGCAICYLHENLFYVRAVRGGYNPAFGDIKRYAFRDNKNGTITDLNTHLVWMQDETPALTQVDALRYCADLDLAGHTDWRLPNIKELATLIDLNTADGTWFHQAYFPDVITKPLGFYASSSTFHATFGWGVNFQFGYDGYYADKKRGRYQFKPVRKEKSQ